MHEGADGLDDIDEEEEEISTAIMIYDWMPADDGNQNSDNPRKHLWSNPTLGPNSDPDPLQLRQLCGSTSALDRGSAFGYDVCCVRLWVSSLSSSE